MHVSACQRGVQSKPWIPHLEAFAGTRKRQRHVSNVGQQKEMQFLQAVFQHAVEDIIFFLL